MPSDIRQHRALNWCFTLNNYTSVDCLRLASLGDDVSYMIAGREVSESGTPHLQGFVKLVRRLRMGQVITLFGQCHLTVTRSVSASIEYCKKDGDFFEVGTYTEKRGNNDKTLQSLDAFKLAVKDGMTDLKDVREQFSDVYSRHFRFVTQYIADQRTDFVFDEHPLRGWQIDMNRVLKGPIDGRSITFVVDLTGNGGKTWFAHYYCYIHENAQVLCPGKKADMAYALHECPRVVFIDCPRSKQGEFLQYDFIEEVKNGYVWASKYESRFKIFKAPHVVVCMNEYPDMGKLSVDRYNVIEI